MGQANVVCAWSADFAMSTSTGPGRPVEAMWKASAIRPGMSAGSVTRKLCLVTGIVMPRMSASWKASVPIIAALTWPVMATIGTESMWASASGVTRFVAPGPEVAMQTPVRPVAAAYPWAAWPAPCSCRTRMCRMRCESIKGSYAGRIAPPGMPKMSVTPAASRDVTRLCAPETCPLCSLIALLPCFRDQPIKKPLGPVGDEG